MINTYRNQNHAVHRSTNPLEKVASVYDRMGVSNRAEKEKVLTFSALAPFESEAVKESIAKEAKALEGYEREKTAAVVSSPFEAFGHAKHYISSKLGLSEDISHDLSSSVVARAQDLQELHGGDLDSMITGIVDRMNPQEVRDRVGASPSRQSSVQEVEESVKTQLMATMQMSAFQADQFKKIVIQQARNLSTSYRNHTLDQLANAIMRVLAEHQDPSIIYGLSTSERLKNEVEYQLTNA